MNTHSSQPPGPGTPLRPAVRVFTLGRFEITRRVSSNRWLRVPPSEWHTARSRRLLVHLLTSPGRRAQREQAMDALWPDLDVTSTSDLLDRSAHELRSVLEPQRLAYAQAQLLTQEHDMIALADQQAIWVDADAFDALMALAYDASHVGNREALFTEAVQLYRGDYLPDEQRLLGVVSRRDHLTRQWVTAMLDLAEIRLACNDAFASIDLLNALLATDPTNEAAAQVMIVALASQSRRVEALRLYQRFEAELARIHSLTPTEQTHRLVEDVRRGRYPTLPKRNGLPNTRH